MNTHVWREALPHEIELVGFQGRLDHNSVADLEMVLKQVLAAGRYWIVVDLDQTIYINSGGLRVLVTAWRTARQHDGDLVLCGLNERLAEIFQMIGFEQVFAIYPTRVDAVDAVGQSLGL